MEEANAMEPQKEPQAETPEEFNVQADEEGGETPAEREETEAWLRDPEGGEETAGPSFLSWVGTVLLLLVPAVNLAVLFEWASGHTRHPIRVNFARAMIPAVLAVYAVLAVGILVL